MPPSVRVPEGRRPRRGWASPAWAIAGALIVALGAVALVSVLQIRASDSRDAEVRLSRLAADFDALQNIPYDTIGASRTEAMVVARRLQAGENRIRRGMAALRSDASTAHLDAVEEPFEANMHVLHRIRALIMADRPAEWDALGPEAGRLQQRVDEELRQAGADYEQRADNSLRLAMLGSGGAILALAGLFGVFYRRSGRAHLLSERLAAENQQLLLRDSQLQVLQRLALAAEYRDDETGDHTRRVGDLAAQIGAALRMPDDDLALLGEAAPLHDVGKIGIPDSILLKPGRLTDEEFDEMRRHTTFGAEMLADGRGLPLLEMAERIALTHHERWDGGGYPFGLSGADIPLVGRIVAVADVFDALTHSRPYKEAWPVGDAIAEIRFQAGKQFDPAVVDAFLTVVGTGQPVRRGLAGSGSAPIAA
jgi:HD-GYP domain-containing protein (c-di-GMP phosphodiesterase class II)